jgi:two-component system cell cycle response regulator
MSEPVAQEAAAKPRVLIVDDSRIVRATIIKHVKGRYEFREEADGEAGWATLLLDPGIQVVISDIGMPRLDGYGFLDRIRSSALSRIREMPFLIISGDEDEATRAKAKELGATDFITKGIGTAELLARLDSLVKLTTTQVKLAESQENRLENPATGLNSRKFVELQVAQVLSHAARHGLPSSVLVMGLDRLDTLQAQYGEAAVALLVQRFGQMVAAKVRCEDSIGHASERTFATISPSTGETEARAFAARVREAIETANVGFQGTRIPLTVSIGIACSPPDAVTGPKDMLALAAERMAQAAQGGGSRVVGSEGERAMAKPKLRVDAALTLLAAGQEDALVRVRAEAGNLGLNLLPLLRLLDAECRLGLQLNEIESILRERARSEEDARP